MTTEQKLAELGIELPAVPAAAGNYVHAVRTGNLLYLAGKGPGITGKVGGDVSQEDAYGAARETGLVLIAVLKDELGDLDRVTRIVKVLGYGQCGTGIHAAPGRDQRLLGSFCRSFWRPRSPCALCGWHGFFAESNRSGDRMYC